MPRLLCRIPPIVAALSALGLAPALAAQPVAPRRPVVDRYPGLTVVDPYRWMERTGSTEFAQWLTAQDAHTTRLLATLPGRDSLAARVMRDARPDDAPRRVRRGGGRLFYLKRDADSTPPTLRTFALDTQRETVLPITCPIARHDPSPDGQWLAVTCTDDGRVRLLAVDVARVTDSLPVGAQVAGWHPDAATLYLTRVVRGVPVVQQRAMHPTATRDSTLLRAGIAGAPQWRATDGVTCLPSPDGTSLALRLVRDDEPLALHVRDRRGRWQRVVAADRTLLDVVWLADALMLLTADGLVRIDPITQRRERLLSADGRALLGMAVASDGLYLLDGTGGEAALWRWRVGRTVPDTIALPVTGSGRSLVAARSAPGVILPIDRWLGDGGWYAVHADGGTRVPLTTAVTADPHVLVERRYARATDGTKIPMTILRRRDRPADRAIATWVMAYGAYGIPMTPLYQSLGPALPMFLDAGGIYVVVHVRGGGEYGAAWHAGGRAATKPNGYRDLIAGIDALIAEGLAQPSRLVVEGSSGGGATVGMAGATRPELFRVVITNVPDANTLRLHATPDGPYMREEWGDSRTAAGVRALAAMDVVRHVREATRYPAWWATTGLQDESVPPWQPAKLIARLQRVETERPVVLRVFAEEGHVLRPAAQRQQLVDLLAFVFWQVGVPGFQPGGR